MHHPLPNKLKINKIHDVLQANLGLFMFAFYTCAVIFLVCDKTGTLFVGSSIPSGLFLTPLKLFLYILHMYIFLIANLSCLTFTCYALLYGYYVVIFYTVELRLGLKPEIYITDCCLRTKTVNLIITLRAFQILHKYFIYVYGKFLLICNALVIGFIIYANFVLVRYWRYLGKAPVVVLGFGGVLGTIIWSAMIEMGRIFYSRGAKVYISWKRKQWSSTHDTKIMMKCLASSKPLILSDGNRFVLRRGSIFIFYKAVTRGIFRALLTTK